MMKEILKFIGCILILPLTIIILSIPTVIGAWLGFDPATCSLLSLLWISILSGSFLYYHLRNDL